MRINKGLILFSITLKKLEIINHSDEKELGDLECFTRTQYEHKFQLQGNLSLSVCFYHSCCNAAFKTRKRQHLQHHTKTICSVIMQPQW